MWKNAGLHTLYAPKPIAKSLVVAYNKFHKPPKKTPVKKITHLKDLKHVMNVILRGKPIQK